MNSIFVSVTRSKPRRLG